MANLKPLEDRVAYLEDRLAIIDLYSTYATALDDLDRDLLALVFDDESYFESANPEVPSRTGVKANWDRLMHRHSETKFTERHITTTPVILRMEEKRAEVTAECIIIKRVDGGPLEFEMLGRYDDEIVRKGDRWVFRRRRFEPNT